MLEQAERLEEIGAGIQLSPNATRTLIDLGLGERLRPHVVAPEALRVLNAKNGREIVRMPLGDSAEQRYGAPYWSIHRGDLQAALSSAVAQNLDISLRLGERVEDFVAHDNGITVSARGRSGVWHEHGDAVIAADGLWSVMRARMGYREPPRFAGRTAWRALLPAKQAPPEFRAPLIHLWLGREAHIVHYPVKDGALINIVVIINDGWNAPGWSAPGNRDELLPRLSVERVAPQILEGFDQPAAGLVEMGAVRPPASVELVARRGGADWGRCPSDAALSGPRRGDGDRRRGGRGAVPRPNAGRRDGGAARLLRSAARAGLESAAAGDTQWAALPSGGAARRADAVTAAMRIMGGTRLLHHYDWLYDWRPPATLSIS